MRGIERRRAIAAVLLSLVSAPTAADAAEPPPVWLGQVRAGLASREYHASPSAGGLQAPNRAHSLRTWFDSTGIRMHDRVADGAPLLFALRWTHLGRADALGAVAPGRVESEGARVEIRRLGVTEWFVNSPEGLEQGFEIEARPNGVGPLRVHLALDAATATGRGSSLTLHTRSGRELQYAKLAARDADGRDLPARFESAASQQIALVVDDSGARYPVSIDPIIGGVAEGVIVPNQADAQLGASLAAAGDVNGDGYADVVVGAPLWDGGENAEGAAFVYLGEPGGIATMPAQRFEGDWAGQRFGTDVAGAGDVDGNGFGFADLVVGSPSSGGGPFVPVGGAYLFLSRGRNAGVAPRSPLGKLLLPWSITGILENPTWEERPWHPLGGGERVGRARGLSPRRSVGRPRVLHELLPRALPRPPTGSAGARCSTCRRCAGSSRSRPEPTSTACARAGCTGPRRRARAARPDRPTRRTGRGTRYTRVWTSPASAVGSSSS